MSRLTKEADDLARLVERSELDLQAQLKRYDILSDKANNLARLVEQLAYAPVSGFYESMGNYSPLKLLKLAVEDVDVLAKKGGARE